MIELLAKEDQIGQAVPLFSELLAQTRRRAGNEGVTVSRDADHPIILILSEQWVSRQDCDAYAAWCGERGDYERLGPLLKQPLRRCVLEYTAV